ncbi:RecX family transcriptional regulator [Prevotella sp. P5-50]|nr:regulatory protein RecX [Prevotella sp. P5-50]OYP41726.1 RecX family transcriptional regulator [Prevotella sp. P5-50]
MNTMTEQEAYLRLAALCAQAEHCEYEMQEKMRRWEIADDAQARVMQRLITERYVDDERFARAFANDKVKYNKWGRRKVEQAMWLKHIAEDIRQRVLDSIDDEEYIAILRPLLQQKRRSVKARNDNELRQKLIKFAIGRGFTMDIIKQCISIDDEEEYDME